MGVLYSHLKPYVMTLWSCIASSVICNKSQRERTSLLLSSSGRSGTSIASERESAGSRAARFEQAGEKTLPELDTRTRLMQLYAECKLFWIKFAVL